MMLGKVMVKGSNIEPKLSQQLFGLSWIFPIGSLGHMLAGPKIVGWPKICWLSIWRGVKAFKIVGRR